MPRTKPAPDQTPHRNRDHTGIWVASFIVRCEVSGEDRSNLNRRCLAWENTVILKARDREVAFKKAVRIGRTDGDGKWYRTTSGKARWVFEGLTDLLPVYEDLADGSELFYRSLHRSVRSLKSMVHRKSDLSVFRDDAPAG